MKADIAMLDRKPTTTFSQQFEQHICEELKSLRQELHHLHKRLDDTGERARSSSNSTPAPNTHNCTCPPTENQRIKITAWNCRGIKNAVPYLNQLIKEGTDIICVSEHWLWPYQITELSNVHQDFEGFGVADRRLNENSDHNRGCGGVGIIWNKSIQASPISNFKSDRFCAVKVSLSNGSTMSLISVYLPSTDHPLDEFEECLNELICVYSALQAEGPVVLLGDFNAHLNHPRNHQGSLLHDAITHSNLLVPSTSCISTGPRYTFFCGLNRTVVDYILMDASLCSSVENCFTHQHHDLNFSDHLPISISINVKVAKEARLPSQPKINWVKAAEDDTLHDYMQDVSAHIQPLLTAEFQTTAELDNQISHVAEILKNAATRFLPKAGQKKSKQYFKDDKLRSLCKSKRHDWTRWNSSGRPPVGELYDVMRETRNNVRHYVARCRARHERKNIQNRDTLFKRNEKNRFRQNQKSSACKGIKINNTVNTRPQDIANHFAQYFQKLTESVETPAVTSSRSKLSSLELQSFMNLESILDTEVTVDEIEHCIKTMKLGRSGGSDGLDPEHVCFGGGGSETVACQSFQPHDCP